LGNSWSSKWAEKGDTLKNFNFIKLTAMAVFAFVAIIGTTDAAFAQGNSNHDKHDNGKSNKQWEKQNKQNVRTEQERLAAERQRQAEWTRYNNQIRIDQERAARRNSGNDRSGGQGYIYGNANDNTNRDAKFRVYRNGSYYQTDYRGAQLLQQAVNEGYRQGFQAGRNDRNRNVRYNWSNSNVYQSGSIGYQSYVARNQYQYYFQQGFQRGYQDGSNIRYANDYNGQYEYGSYQNGSVNILGTILNTILNIRSY
jgi:hypothetical protein